jgi:pilus assembly protein CpaF
MQNQWVGPLAKLIPYFEDEFVTDILVNGVGSFYVEREGVLKAEPNPYGHISEISDLIERLVVTTGKRIDGASPYIDGKLLTGGRFHIILPPLAVHGPIVSFRKSAKNLNLSLKDFCDDKTAHWLSEEIRAKKNWAIAGGTGSGKTTLLGLLLNEVSKEERILLIEETSEIWTSHPHVIALESRPPSPDGKGGVGLRELFKNSLRMRPDRIVLGECRGEEAFDMLQAMNSGHPGSFCTLHASNAKNALERLEALLLLNPFSLSLSAIRRWIAHSLHGIIFMERDGFRRKISEILTLHGLEGDIYRFQPLRVY